MNEWAYNLLLGAVQGITEFLPISSDGHLALAGFLARVPPPSLANVVLLHAGTFVATAWVFRRDIAQLTQSLARNLMPGASSKQAEHAPPTTDALRARLVWMLVAASVPTAVVGLLLEKNVEAWSSVPWIVGAGFLCSALAVLLTKRREGQQTQPSLIAALVIGLAQGLAVMPGLSRSASTIACARLFGMTGPASFAFSFLLSLPAVAGAVLLQSLHAEAFAGMTPATWAGALMAFGVGIASLHLLRRVVSKGQFWWFGFYLVPLGAWLLTWGASR